MYVGALSPVSNRASWNFECDVVDDQTGELVDISTISIVVEVRYPECCRTVLSATTANGKVTNPSTGKFIAAFTRDEMAALCPRTYEIGATLADADDTAQFIIGTVPVLDGVVSR